MRRKQAGGLTSMMIPIYIPSTAGGGLGSLLYNSANLVGEYRREGSSTWTSITLATAVLGTYTSGGFIADGGLAGAYEVGIPNAAIAAGVRSSTVRYYGATNQAAPVQIEFELDQVNYQDPINFGLASLPANARYLVSTGVTSPVTADQYNLYGTLNNAHAYKGVSTGLYCWSNGTNYIISSVLGTAGAAFFTSPASSAVGTYALGGTATGTPLVTMTGNSILSAVQPNIPSITGVVGTVTNNGQFLVIFDTPYPGNQANLILGDKKLTFTSGLNYDTTGIITNGTLTDANHASLIFGVVFGSTVSLGDKFTLIPS